MAREVYIFVLVTDDPASTMFVVLDGSVRHNENVVLIKVIGKENGVGVVLVCLYEDYFPGGKRLYVGFECSYEW